MNAQPAKLQVDVTVRARKLTKTYPSPRGFRSLLRNPFRSPPGVTALREVDFELAKGEICALLGPNGAGKTTFIKILVNLVLPSSGSVEVFGHDLRTDPIEARRRIGYVPSDERSFFWRLSGRENLRFFATLHGADRLQVESEIERCSESFSLGRLLPRRFGMLSSGQKKLFAIVRALIPPRPVLVLDEPTNSLDAHASSRLIEHVRDLARTEGRSAVWATHRLEEVERVADRVALIDRGRISFFGSVQELRRRCSGPTTDRVDQNPLQAILEQLRGEE